METLNKNILSFPVKTAVKLIALMMLLTGLTACPGKGGGGNNGGNVVIPPYGVGNPILLATFEMQSQAIVYEGWNVGTNQLRFTNMQIYGENNWNSQNITLNGYSGAVSLNGTFSLTHTSQAGNCIIPAGSYYVQSSSAGNITQGMNLNAALVSSSGPATLEMTIENGIFGGYGQRLDALVRVVRVNGISCPSDFYGGFN